MQSLWLLSSAGWREATVLGGKLSSGNPPKPKVCLRTASVLSDLVPRKVVFEPSRKLLVSCLQFRKSRGREQHRAAKRGPTVELGTGDKRQEPQGHVPADHLFFRP